MTKLIFALGVFCASIFATDAFAGSALIERAARALQGGGAQTEPPPASVEVAFSPDGGGTDLVIKAIEAAKKNIYVAAYSFTSRPIAKALADAREQGVDVEVVVDHGQIDKESHSVTNFLVSKNILLRVDIVHSLQHDKYMVIDGKTVETGSFNFTAAAEHNNAENVIVLWDDPKLAGAYAANWKDLWDRAEAYKQ